MPSGLELPGQALADQRLRRGGQEHDAAPVGGLLGDALAEGLGDGHALAHQDVRRAEHQAAAAVEGRPAPLAGRGEGHLGAELLGLGRGRVEDRLHRGVARADAGRQGPEALAQLIVVVPVGRHHLDHPQAVVGERPGLVDAHRVHRGQALDGVELLRQRAQSGQPHGGDGEGQAGQEHQALGHDRHQRGDGGARGLVEVRPPDGQHRDEDRRQRDHHPHGQLQDAVDVALQRAEGRPRSLRLGRQPLGEALLAHGLGAVVAVAGHAVGAREHPVAHVADHVVGLAGQDRLVQREGHRVDHLAVGDHLVARLHADDVAGHHVVHPQRGELAVAPDPGPRRDQQGQPVERPLGPRLLDDPDQRVGDDDPAEEGVLVVAQGQDHGEQHAQDQVEEVEDVGPDDLQVGAAGARRLARPGLGQSPARLGRGQAQRGRGGGAVDPDLAHRAERRR